jgi:hypothetical protein
LLIIPAMPGMWPLVGFALPLSESRFRRQEVIRDAVDAFRDCKLVGAGGRI